MTFQISSEFESKPELEYLLSVWGKSFSTNVYFENSPRAILIDSQIVGSKLNQLLSGNINLNERGFLENEDGHPDYLSTAFYLLTGMQEFSGDRDDLGRYPFKSSYQFRFKSVKENTVQFCFDQIAEQLKIKPVKRKTHFFLTHDIDNIHGAIVEDGFNVLKRGRFDLFFKMLFNVAVGKPDWLNMDKIMKLESEYDCRSVFYWIVNKGRINKREINADYDFHLSKIQNQLNLVERNGFENGIHKSISLESIEQEMEKFGKPVDGNRYHYLKYQLPDGFDAVERSKLKLDASLGFAEEAGFRNSYGLPFNPYNFKNRRPYSFVEMPLHVMDRTFYQYKQQTAQQAETEIIDFFERNKENCVLSILWHNNFFTDYKFKGYLNLYKKILAYLKENNFSTISQREIIEQYSL